MDGKIQDNFPVILKCLLVKKHISQRDLANALGVSSTTVSHYVHGLSAPTKRKLEQLADFLEVPITTFYEDRDKYLPYLTDRTDKFSTRLVMLLNENGITGTQLAEAIGVSRQTISYCVNSHQTPTLGLATKIAEYFNVPVSFLLVSDEDRKDNVKLIVSRMPRDTRDCLFGYVDFNNKGETLCRICGDECKLDNGVCPFLEKKADHE